MIFIATATYPGAPMHWEPVLIAGNHRAALALRQGRQFFAYLLTEPEQYSIATTSVGGGPWTKPMLVHPGLRPRRGPGVVIFVGMVLLIVLVVVLVKIAVG